MLYLILPLFMAVSVELPLIQSQTTDTNSNPAFTNIAPCPCDMTENQFDNNCCCDEDYGGSSEFDPVLVSSCIPGTFGGDFRSIDERLCSTNVSFTPDWFPFLCIQFLNSPSLGLYYYPSTTASSTLPANSNSYDISDSTATTLSCSIVQSYNFSKAIVAAYNNSGNGCTSGSLVFPQQSISGSCMRQSPVQYLVGTDASCDVTVTRDLCASNSVLDAAFYTVADVQSNTALTPTVSYLCAQSADDNLFVKTKDGLVAVDTENLFTANPTNDPMPCTYAPPSFVSGVCQNAVASVQYFFTWNAGNITGFDVSITLVDVTATTSDSIVDGGPSNVLAQRFVTTFTPSNSTNSVATSGFPGYEFGLPVMSANDTGASDVNRNTLLAIWKPGTSGLCVDATLEAPQFGFDSVSGCTITFGYFNCTTLRSLVESQQLQLISANVVSRFGNPSNTATSGDWIPVLGNITDFVEENETAGVCDGIPSRAVLEFLWTKSGEQSEQAIREIVGAKVSLIRESWIIPCTETQTSCTVSNYAIYSTVTFTEVPPVATTPEIEYNLRRNDTCDRDATCWPELFLPIQPEFFYLFDSTTADTLRNYNYGWALLVTFFSVAAVFVPAHWNSVGQYLKQVLPI